MAAPLAGDSGWSTKQGWNPGHGTFLVFHISVNMAALNVGPAHPIEVLGWSQRLKEPELERVGVSFLQWEG